MTIINLNVAVTVEGGPEGIDPGFLVASVQRVLNAWRAGAGGTREADAGRVSNVAVAPELPDGDYVLTKEGAWFDLPVGDRTAVVWMRSNSGMNALYPPYPGVVVEVYRKGEVEGVELASLFVPEDDLEPKKEDDSAVWTVFHIPGGQGDAVRSLLGDWQDESMDEEQAWANAEHAHGGAFGTVLAIYPGDDEEACLTAFGRDCPGRNLMDLEDAP